MSQEEGELLDQLVSAVSAATKENAAKDGTEESVPSTDEESHGLLEFENEGVEIVNIIDVEEEEEEMVAKKQSKRAKNPFRALKKSTKKWQSRRKEKNRSMEKDETASLLSQVMVSVENQPMDDDYSTESDYATLVQDKVLEISGAETDAAQDTEASEAAATKAETVVEAHVGLEEKALDEEAAQFAEALEAAKEKEEVTDEQPVSARIVTASDMREPGTPDKYGPDKYAIVKPALTDGKESTNKDAPISNEVDETAKTTDKSASDAGKILPSKSAEETVWSGPSIDLFIESVVSYDHMSGTIDETLGTLEREMDHTLSSTVPDSMQQVHVPNQAGPKLDAFIEAFVTGTACGKMCFDEKTVLVNNKSRHEDVVRAEPMNGSDEDRTQDTGTEYDTGTDGGTDDSQISGTDSESTVSDIDEDTLRSFLEDDRVRLDDDYSSQQGSSVDTRDEIYRALKTLKKHAKRLGVSEAELLQGIRDKKQKNDAEADNETLEPSAEKKQRSSRFGFSRLRGKKQKKSASTLEAEMPKPSDEIETEHDETKSLSTEKETPEETPGSPSAKETPKEVKGTPDSPGVKETPKEVNETSDSPDVQETPKRSGRREALTTAAEETESLTSTMFEI